MKILILALFCAIILLPSCNGGVNILGTNVEIVNNRAADGTFKPVSEVKNAAGESPDSSATVYHYPSGNLGVSAWYSGPLAGQAPKLARPK